MEVQVEGRQGDEARLAIQVVPAHGATMVLGKGDSAEILKPSAGTQVVGTVPCTRSVTINFYYRPWSVRWLARSGTAKTVGSLDSGSLGLQPKVLLKPDTLVLKLAFTDDIPDED